MTQQSMLPELENDDACGFGDHDAAAAIFVAGGNGFLIKSSSSQISTTLSLQRLARINNTMKITETRVAARGAIVLNTLSAKAQNMSYGADNFYISNSATVWPNSFQTQYRTKVAGNLFLPNSLDRSENNSATIVGHPIGAVTRNGLRQSQSVSRRKEIIPRPLSHLTWCFYAGELLAKSRDTSNPLDQLQVYELLSV
ncbi:hypothetical protein J3459_009897 [Metarhizium acridum]|uniref:Alpha/beta superfamily hydrolase, putative n=1 Tax=Metarhizium acridum (strain CQMa 102) TaxID=655827 RepID=E9EA09_METAQ|nr:alpha/beta superfamily hydrolase, putative [Metarhizium acridum CQMa 102]EFY87259.1 alpha/beta superfamily hydrolase, putative [Metarhizium acridum CQMa 102]KAG8422978.1 hypothetical protein J3459_009897 [Metarhizium acridum]KAG8424815.1 hypothetical protein J3458_001576 [Metarhizium acridum]